MLISFILIKILSNTNSKCNKKCLRNMYALLGTSTQYTFEIRWNDRLCLTLHTTVAWYEEIEGQYYVVCIAWTKQTEFQWSKMRMRILHDWTSIRNLQKENCTLILLDKSSLFYDKPTSSSRFISIIWKKYHQMYFHVFHKTFHKN